MKKYKKSKFDIFVRIVFAFSVIATLSGNLIFGSLNASLTMKIQNMNSEISLLKDENSKLNIEICSLSNKDRVYVIAKDAGLNQNQGNIISIQGAE